MRKRGKAMVRIHCLTVSKSLAEFAAFAANKVSILFGQGVYLTENSSQAASVGLVSKGKRNLRAADCKNPTEKPEGIFRRIKATVCYRRLHPDYAGVAAAFRGFMGARVDMACL